MFHTTFHDNRLTGSGEEDFWRVFTLYGHGGHLIMWPGPREQNFVPLSHGCSTWNLTPIGLVVSEEKIFENVNNFTIYGHGSYICHATKLIFIDFHFIVPNSFPMKFGYKWLSGFWEKQVCFFLFSYLNDQLAQGQGMTLTLNIHVVSFTYLATCIYKFSDHKLE